MSEEFSRDYFVKSRDATLMERIFIRLLVPFKALTLLEFLTFKTDDNFITRRRMN